MEIKTWENYTKEEKTELLNHWFYYYGGILISLKDLEDFHALATTKQDEIFDYIVTAYVFNNTIQSNILIGFMRKEETDTLFSKCITRELIKKTSILALDLYEKIREELTNEIVKTFNHPEPPIPLGKK